MKITIFPKVDPYPVDKQEAARHSLIGETKEITNRNEFLEYISNYAWSTSIFKENHRRLGNFISTDFIAFDIDDNISLSEAISRIKLLGYKFIIGTSLNHQKDKDGIVADRYRVIFPLSQSITDIKDYRETWLSIAGNEDSFLYGADVSCKDPSRFFFPCTKISYVDGYRKIKPIKGVEKINKPKIKFEGGSKGILSIRTRQFLETGAENGRRHHEFILALLDFKAQGYTEQEAKDLFIPLMKEIKPNENAEFQIHHIYNIYNVDFDYRKKD